MWGSLLSSYPFVVIDTRIFFPTVHALFKPQRLLILTANLAFHLLLFLSGFQEYWGTGGG